MAGLDFFGAKASNNAVATSTPASAAAVATAAAVNKKKPLLPRPPLSSASSRTSTPASSSSSPASPRRSAGSQSSIARTASTASLTAAHSKSAASSPAPQSQTSSPAPTSTSSTTNTIRRPAVVIVKTFTTASKPRTSASSLSSTNAKPMKRNALPEERRLRIAQEQKQRKLEQEECEYAERKRAEAAREATRPLKKRRTLRLASGSKRSSPALSPVSDRKSRAKTLFSDDDDEDDDNTSPYSTSHKHNAVSKDDWVIPPRQHRSVIRADEEIAVREAQNSAVADEVRNAAGMSTGVTRFTSLCQNAVSSLSVVTSTGLKTFAPYFKDIDDHTIVTLEYPAMHGSEAFPLLVPKPLDEYDPISDLLRTVHVMVSSYFPDEAVRTKLFGRLEELEFTGGRLHPRDSSSPGPAPSTSLHSGHVTPLGSTSASAIVNGAHLSPLSAADPSRASTPLHLTASTSSQGVNGAIVSGGLPAPRLTTPQPGGTATATSTAQSTPVASSTSLSSFSNSSGSISALAGASTSTSTQIDGESILRSFQRARNRRNGPLFLRTVARFNETMRSAKRTGLVLEGIRKMAETGIPERLWANIHEQTYARIVGPKVEELNHYTAFSDNVYGELLPRFTSEIANLTGLGPSSTFVDLGSGVGNVLVQLALQTGCSAYGCEMMETPARLADAQIDEAKARWAMWGLEGGHAEAWKADFCASERVGEVLRKADVVLVNNYAFTPRTNDKLVLQFLDLKDGCHIISLKPFVPPDFRLTERTLSSPLAILRVVERTYGSGCVSWADGGGRYYIHTVDRKLVQDFQPALVGRGDTRRRRWKKNPEEEDDEMMTM
ncbi:Nucleosomal histone H3-Lys79 methylase [Tilletia horrida]|nr:Nucleosomal histone H3-Lys79 methylase [Tilletia horrida]